MKYFYLILSGMALGTSFRCIAMGYYMWAGISITLSAQLFIWGIDA